MLLAFPSGFPVVRGPPASVNSENTPVSNLHIPIRPPGPEATLRGAHGPSAASQMAGLQLRPQLPRDSCPVQG